MGAVGAFNAALLANAAQKAAAANGGAVGAFNATAQASHAAQALQQVQAQQLAQAQLQQAMFMQQQRALSISLSPAMLSQMHAVGLQGGQAVAGGSQALDSNSQAHRAAYTAVAIDAPAPPAKTWTCPLCNKELKSSAALSYHTKKNVCQNGTLPCAAIARLLNPLVLLCDVSSLPRCVLPYMYRKRKQMVWKLIRLFAILGSRDAPRIHSRWRGNRYGIRWFARGDGTAAAAATTAGDADADADADAIRGADAAAA